MNEQMDRLWTKVDKRKIPEPQAMMNYVDYSLWSWNHAYDYDYKDMDQTLRSTTS